MDLFHFEDICHVDRSTRTTPRVQARFDPSKWPVLKRPLLARFNRPLTLYDVRSALSMIAQGVTEFATVNTKDFEGLGFQRVWNPLGSDFAE